MSIEGPLHALFLRAWSTVGFSEEFVGAPHAHLARAGLAVGSDVAVVAFVSRQAREHLCLRCQLAIPELCATLGLGRVEHQALSPLDALFADGTRSIDTPREVLAALGIPVSLNVRVELRRGAVARLELQVCPVHHACLCDAPELESVVFATWPT